MQYLSRENRRRAQRGDAILRLHSDFGDMTDDPLSELETSAADTIADILHALNEAGSFGEQSGAERFHTTRILGRAQRSFFGDFEDEPMIEDLPRLVRRSPGVWEVITDRDPGDESTVRVESLGPA